jgi:hypothetical protein
MQEPGQVHRLFKWRIAEAIILLGESAALYGLIANSFELKEMPFHFD